MVDLVCLHCARTLRAPQSMIGQQVTCPACQKAFVATARDAPVAMDVGEDHNSGAMSQFSGVNVHENEPSRAGTAPASRGPTGRTSQRRKKSLLLPVSMAVAAILVLGGASVAYVLLKPPPFDPASLALEAMADQELNELESLRAPVAWKAQPPEQSNIVLVDGPRGARLEDGHVVWTTTEAHGPGEYQIQLQGSHPRGKGPIMSWTVRVHEVDQPPQWSAARQEYRVRAGQPIRVTISAGDPDTPKNPIRYRLGDNAPENAQIDVSTGALLWTPDKGLADGDIRFDVVATEQSDSGEGAESLRTLTFHVAAAAPSQHRRPQTVAELQAALEELGALTTNGRGADPVLEREVQHWQWQGERLAVATFDDGAALDDAKLRLLTAAEKEGAAEPCEVFSLRDGIVRLGDSSPRAHRALKTLLGEPMLVVAASDPLPDSASSTNSSDAAMSPNVPAPVTGPFSPDEEALLLAAASEGKLFDLATYPKLRAVFAQRFERIHAHEIQQGLGERSEELQTWLEEHPVLKEELYTALSSDDDIPAAMRLFAAIQAAHPDRIVPYGNLAIAIAVTWDNPRSVYDYARHQRRAKAAMPDDLVGALENFRYFVEAEQLMQGRAQWLPWEFLVHVVNHRTPLRERQWAVQNYLPKRSMFGKCYHDVPYDHVMLDTKSAQARMNNQDYHLPNLKVFGGVCAHQADYASRVGQSLGVPAAYVGGENIYGGRHAWVMWVEVRAVTATSIQFSLKSYGRYRGDKYYVGTLRDPKSGQQITDRQLELRLHNTGTNPQAKRHGELLMAAYPLFRKRTHVSVDDAFKFLNETIKLAPGNEAAWRAVADLAQLPEVREDHREMMERILKQLFVTFGKFPDYTWEIFDDLLQFEDNPKKRIGYYQQLAVMYQAAQRPDLSCEARLKLAELLVDDDRANVAIEGLAATIHLFVDEGRYVPRMLDRVEQLAGDIENGKALMVNFYQSFLPKIPKKRNNSPSKYCVNMHRRAVNYFQSVGATQLAQLYSVQAQAIEAGAAGK